MVSCWAQLGTRLVKIADLFVIFLLASLPPGSELISLEIVMEVCKMASKPLKDLFDEQSELYDSLFGDDAKL